MTAAAFVLPIVLLAASASEQLAKRPDPLPGWERVFAAAETLRLNSLPREEVCLINPAGNSNHLAPTVGIYFNAASDPVVASVNGFSTTAWCLDVIHGLRRTSAALAHSRLRPELSDAVTRDWRRVYRQHGRHIIVRSEVVTGDGTVLVSYQSAHLDRHRVPCDCADQSWWAVEHRYEDDYRKNLRRRD
jgi:hypothetical protein